MIDMSNPSPSIKFHELKTIPPFFEQVYTGLKTFELRKNDRDFRVGEMLQLREYEPTTKQYSGRYVWKKIIYILKDFEGLADGFVILGII